MAAIIFTITSEGLTASLDAANTGLGLQLTHVSGHDAAGVEIGQWPLSGGIVEPNSNTLRFSSVMTSTTRKELYGLKLLGDSLVFATSVGASPLVVVDANIDFAPAFGLALESIPVGSITVSTDPNAPLAIILMLQHLGAANPHPQYTMKAVFDNHVGQNTLEHNNLLAMIQAVNQRVANLEIREEIQIGEFVITDDPRNPVLYKGYGSWRLVPDVLLKGLDFDGTVGQFSQVAAGSDQSVRTTFFWQRFDPSVIAPLRTISISADSTDVNLLVLFTATYGAPVIGERIKFVVESDVLVTASTTSNYAIVTGDWPPDSDVSMDVFGIVAGRGGNGGRSAEFRYPRAADVEMQVDKWMLPTAGENGGDAILATTTPLEVINHNIVAGGGAGGGGMGGWVAQSVSLPGGNFGDGIGASGGAGGGAPFGKRAPNQNTYEAYLLNPLFAEKGNRDSYPDAGFFIQSSTNVLVFNQTGQDIGGQFGSQSLDPNYIGAFVFPQYIDADQVEYTVKTYRNTSKPIRMSQDGTATEGGLGGYGSPNNYFVSFADENSPADLSLNYGGRGGDIGQNGEAGVMQAFYKEDGSTRTQAQLALYIPPAEGGLAGIAITGPVTVTGNPVLGR